MPSVIRAVTVVVPELVFGPTEGLIIKSPNASPPPTDTVTLLMRPSAAVRLACPLAVVTSVSVVDKNSTITLDLLKAAEDIYGPNAPEKLLYSVFKKKTAALKAKAKGETVAERAKWLAHVRDAEGYMSQFINNNDKDGGPHILECHSPILNVLEQYPIIGRFEQDMFEAVLGTRVRREVIRNSGLYECAFQFAA